MVATAPCPTATSTNTSPLLTRCWYFATPGFRLKPGQTVLKTILGHPILIGRDSNGTVFAIHDICPHQGMPLHYGCFNGKEAVCPFHGWKFGTDGVCTEIPSLVEAQKSHIHIDKIKVRAFPCIEHQGCVWVYVGEPGDIPPPPPEIPGIPTVSHNLTVTTLHLPSHIDYAVIALMDPAHVPFVHDCWWFRSPGTMKEKSKRFAPSHNGFTMVRHKASTASPVYALIGGVPETEIRFELPGTRIEHISIDGKTIITGVTTLTPIDETQTEINHLILWNNPLFTLAKPIIQIGSDVFLKQDQLAAIRQQEGLKHAPQLIVSIPDAGTPIKWYMQLKQAWANTVEQGQPFENPLSEQTLHWRT